MLLYKERFDIFLQFLQLFLFLSLFHFGFIVLCLPSNSRMKVGRGGLHHRANSSPRSRPLDSTAG